MLAEGAFKDKEGTTTSEADNPANKTSKLQIKLKKELSFVIQLGLLQGILLFVVVVFF